MIKISGFTDEVSLNLDKQLLILKELGESYMCPRSIDGTSIAEIGYDKFVRDIKPRLDNANVKFSSIGSPIGKVKLADEEGYQKQLDKLSELVKIAKEMDCKYIRVFSFFVDSLGDYDKYFPIVVEKMKGFLKVVEGTDVILLHENEKHIYGDTPERVLQLYNAINNPQFALCYDASNYIQCNCDPLEAYNKVKDYTVYYHMKDCIEGVEVPLGIGDGKIQEVVNDLVQNAYDGFLTLEPHTLKYALTKRLVYLLPLKKFATFRKVYELIDIKCGVKKMEKVTRKQVYLWQYNNLKAILNKAGV
ncbi:MAG TPA: sugar phosphate isomerase/epimerase [Clostridia bacterium]|nr:sugar phosphate isomerase/epimerase [Clostridia bacterium]